MVGGGGGGGPLRRVGKYEVGRTIGEGTFAKVKFAQNTETGESVAMKVLDRSSILKHKMVDQVRRGSTGFSFGSLLFRELLAGLGFLIDNWELSDYAAPPKRYQSG
jgi:serine/threonine protein kinase